MTPRMRILMVISELGYGGAEGDLLRLANYLSRTMRVTIAVMARTYDCSDYSTAGSHTDLPVVILDEGHNAARRGSLFKALRWMRMLWRLRAMKRDHEATISFLQGPNLLSSLAGGRATTIISERGSKRFDFGMSKTQRLLWTRILDRIAYARSERIVAASNELADEIITANPLIAVKTLSIEGSVEAERLLELADAPVDIEFSAFAEYHTVVSFGRMHLQKGFDFLIRVFARVRQSDPRARLLLIGDGPRLHEYILLASELGLRAGQEIRPDRLDVVFCGYRVDPVRFLKFGHAFAMPSRYEGLPNALIEALAAGIPIFAADCPWGPRSILAGAGDAGPSVRDALPLALTHGTLMPQPDAPGSDTTWEKTLASALAQPLSRRPLEVRRAAVSPYDIEWTGPQWVELIHAVVAPS